jgi:hypothetical protein
MPKEDTQFKPGQSGNPSGRPKNTLKDYTQRMFSSMSDEQKLAWLKSHKVTGIDMWKMAEGLPKADIEHSGEVTSKIISIDE